MYYLFCDKECQKPEKYRVIDGNFDNFVRNGRGEQQFENGCIYRGDFVDDAFHGQGEFLFPEQTKISGFFDNNHFRKGTIALSIGLKIACLTETDYETFEDFFKDFKVAIAPDCVLTGTTNSRGHLETAQIIIKNEVVATYQNTNLVFKLPNDSKNHLIVSRLWFYVGEVINSTTENHTGPVFDGQGSQVWYAGIGYNQGSRQLAQLNGTQLMLRHCAGLQFFRNMKYVAGKFENAITIFNNGLIFSTEDDYFKGTLKVFLQNGDELEFECALNDYSSLKLGSIKSREDDSEIKFFEKANKLVFCYKGREVSLDEFKAMLG